MSTRALDQHIAECASCATELASLRRIKWLMATTAPPAVPPDLAGRLNVALAQQLAARRDHWRVALPMRFLRWENALNGYMLPATGGLFSAVLIFGLLIGFLVPAHLHPRNDVPTMLYTPPEMTAAPFGLEQNSTGGDAVLVEAVIDFHGQVEDYRVLNPAGQSELSPAAKNALIFARFRPATSFGVPTSGRVVISFSNINVGG
jgi:TonB family protein